GLIQDTVTLDNRGIPFLRDIPVLGYLFRFTGRKVEKTELLLLITPRVVGTAIDAAKITNEMRRATPELDEAVDKAPRAPRFTPTVPPPRPPLPGSPLPPSSPLAPRTSRPRQAASCRRRSRVSAGCARCRPSWGWGPAGRGAPATSSASSVVEALHDAPSVGAHSLVVAAAGVRADHPTPEGLRVDVPGELG